MNRSVLGGHFFLLPLVEVERFFSCQCRGPTGECWQLHNAILLLSPIYSRLNCLDAQIWIGDSMFCLLFCGWTVTLCFIKCGLWGGRNNLTMGWNLSWILTNIFQCHCQKWILIAFQLSRLWQKLKPQLTCLADRMTSKFFWTSDYAHWFVALLVEKMPSFWSETGSNQLKEGSPMVQFHCGLLEAMKLTFLNQNALRLALDVLSKVSLGVSWNEVYSSSRSASHCHSLSPFLLSHSRDLGWHCPGWSSNAAQSVWADVHVMSWTNCVVITM